VKFRSALIVSLAIFFSAAPLLFAKEESQKVDSGSFGVFINGRRVGTEKFSISKDQNGSTIQSEFRTENTTEAAAQTSEMQLTPVGDIRRYDWKELSPGKGTSTITPNDQFLSQKWSAGGQDKEHEQQYILPASTSILDDFFFVHREVLAWKFFGGSCKQNPGQLPQCPVKQRTQFGTLNPRQRASSPISMEFTGAEKINLHGSDQELYRVEMQGDIGTWVLWFDSQFKLQRISVPSENTEVTRD
jgi:hypothetical protein